MVFSPRGLLILYKSKFDYIFVSTVPPADFGAPLPFGEVRGATSMLSYICTSPLFVLKAGKSDGKILRQRRTRRSILSVWERPEAGV